MKNFIFISFLLIGFTTAQNKLYVRVEYNPSMQLLGFGGSGFFYDHILLLPDGTAFRFDDVSDGFDQILPGGINLVTATTTELATSSGTPGTYQDDGATITTSFGVSFASTGEEYSSVMEESGYMFVPPLQASFITGEYNNFSGTVIGGGFTGTPSVMAGESNNYFFYGDGKFGFEESSGVSSEAGNVGTTYSSEGSAAGSYLFEGYNLFLTYNDGSQAVLPAYLWPPYQPFIDQILMVGDDEFLNEEESTIPIQLLPATGATPANGSVQNPLAGNTGQNPLSTPQGQNPLSAGAEASGQNPLTQPPGEQTQENPLTTEPQTASVATLSGTVSAPTGVTRSGGFVILCPYDVVDENDCITATIEVSGAYSLGLPGPGEYLVMAAMDADGNNSLNTGDYVSYESLNSDGSTSTKLDFLLEPYSE